MTCEPNDLLERLEFAKIVEGISRYCLGDLGAVDVASLAPGTNLDGIRQSLDEISETMRGMAHADSVSLSHYEDIREDLRMLVIEDYVLAEDACRRISIQLAAVARIYRFFQAERLRIYPALSSIIQAFPFDFSIVSTIDKVIDAEGNIRADASPELAKIRRSIQSKVKELDKVFRQIVLEFRQKGWLSDNLEAYRNGRRVLSVPSEHKRKIRGIIHDESATGRTTYIEPEGVIEINNDVFDLEQEERREIYRILKALSAFLRPYAPLFSDYQKILIRFDVIQAKARFSQKISAEKPDVDLAARIKLKEGRHPLLLLKNEEAGKVTVPFSVELGGENSILVLSGPNAGGKSIAMKTVGLLQLMVQSGLPVPAKSQSTFGIFREFFADIGDQQSIEDDLSTYSSRLINMHAFLQKCSDASLLLIDEFGSGTDPQFGGAIAEAILREFNARKVSGVITTHYANLKLYAYNTPGIMNGCMAYDMDHLTPTYQFIPGRPGSSYAFEIALKSGLRKDIIQYAQSRTRKNEKEVDELLVDLQKEKQLVGAERLALKEKQEMLDKLVRGYEAMQKDYEFRRKRFKLDLKQQELQETGHLSREIDRRIREIQALDNIEKARELASRLREERLRKQQEVDLVKEEIQQALPEKAKDELKVGSYVRLKSGGATGVVFSMDKDKATVQMGDLKLLISTRDLDLAPEPLDKKARSLHIDAISGKAAFESKLDIRGMRMHEALQVIESYVDAALMNSASHLEIIHGKGDGVLRKAVRNKLKEFRVPMEISHPEPNAGGDGVTLVAIR